MQSSAEEEGLPTSSSFHVGPQQQRQPFSVREIELQKLLAEERQRSEQRKNNYTALKEEHLKLQKDYLALQSEVRQILEETKLLKNKKDSDLQNALKVISEKDKLIERLRGELRERDPQLLKESFEQELQEPLKRLQKEKETLLRDKERMLFELKMMRQKVEHLEKECVDGVERVRLSYDAQINLVQKEKEELRLKLVEASQTPDAQKLLTLLQENSKLKARVSTFQSTLDETQAQYKKIGSKVEEILSEQERNEKQHETETQSYKNQILILKDENVNLQSLIKQSRREKEETLFEVKRQQNEIALLRGELEDKQKQSQSDKEKMKISFIKEKDELQKERDRLTEELKRIKVDNRNKAEMSQTLEKSFSAKEKDWQMQLAVIQQQELEKRSSIEREKSSLEGRVRETQEDKTKLKDEIDHLKKQLESNADLRLSSERDLLILRAKLESYQPNIEELDKLRRQHVVLHDELNKIKSENAENLAINRELTRQKERYKEEYERIREDLEEERKQLNDFKMQSEKSLAKLKNCLEDERSEWREQISTYERELLKREKEKDEARMKYKQYANIAEKLQDKLSEMRVHQQIAESKRPPFSRNAYHQHHSCHKSSKLVPAEVHGQRHYRDLRRRQSEISNLLNCTFDTTECKQIEKND